jgi:hypothetical protein
VSKFLKLLLPVVALCGALAPASGRDTIAGPVVPVRQGEEWKVRGEDLRITFLAVEEDSRCPEGVHCIHAGNARVRVMARNSKGACAEFVINSDVAPKEQGFGKYKIRMAGLWPRPTAAEPRPRSYRAAFEIEKVKK